jgi:hypothetical protein
MKSKAFAVQCILETTENLAKCYQFFGRFLSFNTKYGAFGCLFVIVVVITSCGGGGYDPNNVTVAVAPAAATIPANGQVTLQATVNGLCSTCTSSIYLWSIAEDNNGGGCDWFTSPPLEPCPAGTIQETSGPLSNTLTVTYFAPGTPGTYHVVAGWSAGFGAPITKTATTVVTVSP